MLLGAAVNLMLRHAFQRSSSSFFKYSRKYFFLPIDFTIPSFLSTLEIEEFPNTRLFIVQQARQTLHSLDDLYLPGTVRWATHFLPLDEAFHLYSLPPMTIPQGTAGREHF